MRLTESLLRVVGRICPQNVVQLLLAAWKTGVRLRGGVDSIQVTRCPAPGQMEMSQASTVKSRTDTMCCWLSTNVTQRFYLGGGGSETNQLGSISIPGLSNRWLKAACLIRPLSQSDDWNSSNSFDSHAPLNSLLRYLSSLTIDVRVRPIISIVDGDKNVPTSATYPAPASSTNRWWFGNDLWRSFLISVSCFVIIGCLRYVCGNEYGSCKINRKYSCYRPSITPSLISYLVQVLAFCLPLFGIRQMLPSCRSHRMWNTFAAARPYLQHYQK